MSNAKRGKAPSKPKTKKRRLPKPLKRRRLLVDPCLIDVNAPLDAAVLVHRETLHLLRTLSEAEAWKLLGQIILAAEHDGAIPESAAEKKTLRVHKRVIKAEENPPNEDGEPSAARQYRRDRADLGLDPRPVGSPPGPRKNRTKPARRLS